jgi:predicted metal-binding membrane protein
MFLGVSTLLFITSTVVTLMWCGSMSCCTIDMPGGWTLSMMYQVMPGQTWIGAAAEFLGMWLVMMVAMMLPSLVPMLWRYHRSAGLVGEAHPGRLTVLVGLGYFLAWTLFGVIAFLLGVAASALVLEVPPIARAVPLIVGTIVLGAGLTTWKARHLACCRTGAGLGETVPAEARSAWRHGLRLGLHCGHCCFGLTAILLVVGAMDLWIMAVVTVAISAERLLPAGERMARIIGVVIVAAGLFLIVHALVPG